MKVKLKIRIYPIQLCNICKLLHIGSTAEGLQPEAIDLQSLVLYDLVEVDVALVVVALEVGAVDVLQFVELHGVHPAGAHLKVALLAVGKGRERTPCAEGEAKADVKH